MTEVRSVRLEVFARDGGCIAPVVDPDAGPCYDKWGHILPDRGSTHPWFECEMDYVRLGATGKRHELVTDHVTVCPGHHRGAGPLRGYQWATAHRPEQRQYLEAQRWRDNGSDTGRPTS